VKKKSGMMARKSLDDEIYLVPYEKHHLFEETIAEIDALRDQLLKQLQTVSDSLQYNSKIVIPTGQSLVNVVADLSGMAVRK
jgi:hypothetical protein